MTKHNCGDRGDDHSPKYACDSQQHAESCGLIRDTHRHAVLGSLFQVMILPTAIRFQESKVLLRTLTETMEHDRPPPPVRVQEPGCGASR